MGTHQNGSPVRSVLNLYVAAPRECAGYPPEVGHRRWALFSSLLGRAHRVGMQCNEMVGLDRNAGPGRQRMCLPPASHDGERYLTAFPVSPEAAPLPSYSWNP